MATKAIMKWDEKARRWYKMYKGHRLVVSCRQLGADPTKESSTKLANDWFLARQQEIDNAINPDHEKFAEQIEEIQAKQSWLQDYQPPGWERRAKAYGTISEILGDKDAKGLPFDANRDKHEPGHIEAIRWQERLRAKPGASKGKSSGTSIGSLFEDYRELQKSQVAAGLKAVKGWENKFYCLTVFVDWLDRESNPKIIDSDKWEQWYLYLMAKLGKSHYSHDYAKKIYSVSKEFVRYLWEKNHIDLPKTIDSRQLIFGESHKEVRVFTKEEIKLLLAHATGQMPLHLTLMLNCGMTQVDIAELQQQEVDWAKGTITRKRSKTRGEANTPIVTYKLWQCTMDLLRQHNTGTSPVLLTQSGSRWVYDDLVDGKKKSTDSIASNWVHLRARVAKMESTRIDLPLKCLRKTAASALDNHPEYGRYTQYFLGHSPRGVAAKHYTKPSDTVFFAALDWLGKELGLVD